MRLPKTRATIRLIGRLYLVRRLGGGNGRPMLISVTSKQDAELGWGWLLFPNGMTEKTHVDRDDMPRTGGNLGSSRDSGKSTAHADTQA